MVRNGMERENTSEQECTIVYKTRGELELEMLP